MVSKASELLPEPERPVTTVRVLRGMETEMFFRLCWRAPRTVMCVMGARGARDADWGMGSDAVGDMGCSVAWGGVWDEVAKTLGYGICAATMGMGEAGFAAGCPDEGGWRPASEGGGAGILEVTPKASKCVYLARRGLPE